MLEQTAPLVTIVARSLTSFERLVLELHYIDRLPSCDISEVLEISEQTVIDTLAEVRTRINGVRKTFVETLCEAASLDPTRRSREVSPAL